MDRIRIRGGRPLSGNIDISGAKNAALPLMIVSLLTDQRLTLRNVPRLADVNQLLRILRNHGVDMSVDGKRAGEGRDLGETVHLTAAAIVDTTAPYELVSRMRASFWVLGPLLARAGRARVSLPGGCAIGTRPVDLHLAALSQLGATIEIEQGYVVASAPHRPQGQPDRVSQGVGRRHPQCADGRDARQRRNGDRKCRPRARGRRRRRVPGEDGRQDRRHRHFRPCASTASTRLQGADHRVIADRIETGTYAMAAAMTGGDVTLSGACADTLDALLAALDEAGVEVKANDGALHVTRNGTGSLPSTSRPSPIRAFRPISRPSSWR